MTFKGSKADLIRSLNLIPAVLAGTYPDLHGLHAIFWGYVGNAVLKLAQDDYKAKMLGGVGLNAAWWAELAKSTLAKRKRAGRTDEDILYETGALLKSLTPGADDFRSNADDQVFDLQRDGVKVGTKVAYVDYHQKGIAGRMPARPVIPTDLPLAWESEVEEAMQEGLKVVIGVMVNAGGLL